MDQPFDRVDIGIRERPVSSDINRSQGQIYRTITDLVQQLFGGSVNPESGFLGGSFAVSAQSPAAMSVSVGAGMGFLYNPADVPTEIGTPDLGGVDDVSPYKPVVLVSPVSFVVPPAPAGPNSRIDIIECRVNRLLVDSTPRYQLDTATKTFLPKSFFKTLSFTLDGFTGFATSPADSTFALSYKIGAAANPGVAPATTVGYVKLAEIHVGSGVVVINAVNVVDARQVLLPLGSFVGRQLFAVNNTYTPTPGTRRVRVRMVGAGGGGGGVSGAAVSCAAGGGGASGRYLELNLTGTPLITGGAVGVGSAGAGGAAGANNGAAGGDTTVLINGTTYTAKGGGGGSGNAANLNFSVGSGGLIPGGSSAGDVIAGSHGHFGMANENGTATGSGGNGGSCPLGAGGAGSQNAGGGSAIGYGGGGGGGENHIAANVGGGSGSDGLVIVDEYL